MKKSLMYVLLAMVMVIVSAPFVFAAPELPLRHPRERLITPKQS